jgi:hypothetical protein
MHPLPIRPARFWYWVAGGLLAAAVACVALAVASFVALAHQISGFQRVPVPGQARVTFTSTGGYLVYFEGPGQGRGRARLLLRDTSDGRLVQVSDLSGRTESYALGGHSGQSVASLSISRPGRYVLSAARSSGPAPADVAVGRGLGADIVRGVVLILAAVFTFAGSVITGVITALRRGRARRRPEPAGNPAPPPPVG